MASASSMNSKYFLRRHIFCVLRSDPYFSFKYFGNDVFVKNYHHNTDEKVNKRTYLCSDYQGKDTFCLLSLVLTYLGKVVLSFKSWGIDLYLR